MTTDVYRLISQTQAAYARTIDDDRLEEWPAFFADPCSYVITTAASHREGLEAGIVYCTSQGMLRDRISALGLVPTGTSAQALRQIQKADQELWAPAIRASGFKPSD